MLIDNLAEQWVAHGGAEHLNPNVIDGLPLWGHFKLIGGLAQ